MKIEKNTSDLEWLIAEFDKRSLKCSIRNSKRTEIKLKDIPNNLQKVFTSSMKRSVFKENPTSVYCKKCVVYSMLSSIKTGSIIK